MKKPSVNKNKKAPPPPESTPNPSLPDDLLLSCFARASRLYYPTLSLVSKSFASLVSSPELYKTRSSSGRTESCLYVCLSFHPDPIPRWFTLCRKPDRTLTTKKKPSGYALAKLPTPPSRSAHWPLDRISTTLADPLTKPTSPRPASQSWTVGPTRGATVQACWWSGTTHTPM